MTLVSKPKKRPTKFSEEMIISTIESHSEGVLTTINTDGTPSSSVITLHTLKKYHYFFMTKDSTKKYDNLERNPNVTFMIFDKFSRTELEIKGIVELIWDSPTKRRALKIIDEDTKKGRRHTSPYVSTQDDFVLFRIYPQSIHFATFWDGGKGPEMFQAAIEFSLTDTNYAD